MENSASDRLKKIHASVNRVKSSEEAGVKFMRQWIERIDYLAEGREQATLDSLRKLMQKKHMTAEEAVDFLEIPESERKAYLEKLEKTIR